jgi:DNA primase
MPGYSIDEDILISKLVEKGWSSEDIISSGAIRTRYLSLFSEQNVTFVVKDAYGKPIGFVTRPINPNGRAKYINSPESSLYSKSEALLGLDVALKEGDAKANGVYIVEGPGDLAQLYRIGVKNAVAICGTALTQKHLIVLKSVGIRRVYLNFDWDNAGTIATQRVLENVIGATSGMSVFVVGAPEGSEATDPDEFLKEVHEADPEIYLSLEKKTAFEWQLSQTSENDSPDAICQRMIPSIAAEEAAIRREILISTLQEFTGISRQAILTDVNALRDDSFNKRKEQLTAAAEIYVESVREDPENIQAHVSAHEAKIHNIEKEFRKHSVGINYQLSRYEATQERRMSSTQDVNMSTFKMNHHSDFAKAMSCVMPWTTGCLMYVGGRANSGKTAGVLSIGCDIALSDENAIVIIHATDDSYEQIELRLKTNVFRMIS